MLVGIDDVNNALKDIYDELEDLGTGELKELKNLSSKKGRASVSHEQSSLTK